MAQYRRFALYCMIGNFVMAWGLFMMSDDVKDGFVPWFVRILGGMFGAMGCYCGFRMVLPGRRVRESVGP